MECAAGFVVGEMVNFSAVFADIQAVRKLLGRQQDLEKFDEVFIVAGSRRILNGGMWLDELKTLAKKKEVQVFPYEIPLAKSSQPRRKTKEPLARRVALPQRSQPRSFTSFVRRPGL